ncbi:hypothetical protein GTP44_22925 [Duganella sp. FT50W]|uniref:DUF3300 domain-containing protein n=1 Tax=Duganella lactea TaxID=2692173 RepID=A0A6L8MRX9_9BURK|nr:hypothetical protein [Duganella lactea]MYM84785.1 hypothetical protein [Duganella lactea]
MKAMFLAASLLALSASALASNTAVSVSVGQPGFYGRIDIGNSYPAPQLIYPQPVIIERPVRYVEAAPIYLHVPPGHAKNWKKHCRAYHACGQRVYFVQDGWYNQQYVPRYRERHGGPRHDRDDRRDDRYDDRRDDRGPGRGHGNGHGNGHGRDR